MRGYGVHLAARRRRGNVQCQLAAGAAGNAGSAYVEGTGAESLRLLVERQPYGQRACAREVACRDCTASRRPFTKQQWACVGNGGSEGCNRGRVLGRRLAAV